MSEYSNILDKIVARKRKEIAIAHKKTPLQSVINYAEQADEPRGFEMALRRKPLGIIAEIKKASPSKGIIAHAFDPASIASGYEKSGAACISCLTDQHFFKGSKRYFLEANRNCTIPMLRKDFMLDPYQIIESRAINADCVLLIAACLSDTQMQELHQTALDYGMDVLIEVHNRRELERALQLPTGMIGINNRDLKTFKVSLNTTLSLRSMVPASRLIVTESGIKDANDIDLMMANQIRHFLIGEQFMKTPDPSLKLKVLLDAYRNIRYQSNSY